MNLRNAASIFGPVTATLCKAIAGQSLQKIRSEAALVGPLAAGAASEPAKVQEGGRQRPGYQPASVAKRS